MTKQQFQETYEQWFDPIRSYLYYRSGNEDLATDLCQEVFLRLWAKRNGIRLAQVKSLLYKMASDQYVDHLRKRRVRKHYLGSLKLRWQHPAIEMELQAKELKDRYESVLARLPEHQRITFLMSRIEGLSYREIADRLGLSVKAIEKRMGLALSILKKELNDA